MSNILNLPQIPSGTTITIAGNADWDDTFTVFQPGFSTTPVQLTGTTTATSLTVGSLSSGAGVIPGMPVLAYGVPVGAEIEVFDGTTITLTVPPTISVVNCPLTLYPPPLDLTGIAFTSKLRLTATDPTVWAHDVDGAWYDGQRYDGRPRPIWGWSVPAASLPAWPVGLAQAR